MHSATQHPLRQVRNLLLQSLSFTTYVRAPCNALLMNIWCPVHHASVVAPCSALATDQGRWKGGGGLLVWSAYKVKQMPVFFGAIPTNHWLATQA